MPVVSHTLWVLSTSKYQVEHLLTVSEYRCSGYLCFPHLQITWLTCLDACAYLSYSVGTIQGDLAWVCCQVMMPCCLHQVVSQTWPNHSCDGLVVYLQSALLDSIAVSIMAVDLMHYCCCVLYFGPESVCHCGYQLMSGMSQPGCYLVSIDLVASLSRRQRRALPCIADTRKTNCVKLYRGNC